MREDDTVTVDRGPMRPSRDDSPADGQPERRDGGLRVPLRVWVISGLIGALVLITATGGIRNWWAHRLHDMTGGSKPADFVIGLVVGSLPLIAVGFGAWRSRGHGRFRRAWRMFYFGAAGFIVTYLLSPSLSRVLTSSSARRVFEHQAPAYLPGVFTGTVLWLLVLALLVARARARWRSRRTRPADPNAGTHRVIDV
jgi:hypothetical protein